MRVVLVGPFGFRVKMTMARRAMPMARELARRGHDVYVIVPPWDSPEDAGKNHVDQGAQVIQVLTHSHFVPLNAICTSIAMVRAVLTARPQVVHCFKPKAYSGLVHCVLWLLRCLRIWNGALIVDEDDWEGRGGWNERSDRKPLFRWLVAWQEQWGLRHADAVTVASHWLLEKVTQKRDCEHGVHYLPNCLDPLISGMAQGAMHAGSSSGARKLRDRNIVILVTRFVEVSPSDICSIWRQVIREIPCSQLLVVGQGFRNETDALRTEAEQLGIAGSISMRGWVSRSSLGSLLRSADVAIMPADDSIVSEAKFPTRMLDAMGVGLPIVASDVGECSYLIEDEVSGLLVPPGDSERFSGAVVRLLGDVSLRSALGDGAASVAHERHNCPLLVDALEQVYVQLANNH